MASLLITILAIGLPEGGPTAGWLCLLLAYRWPTWSQAKRPRLQALSACCLT